MSLADVVITGTTPAAGQAVDTNTPDLLIDFSDVVDVATATTDSICIYRLGLNDLTPASDDTLIPISGITSENAGTRLRVSLTEALPDGDYAWVVYGSASSRSGAGNDLHFTNSVATLSLAAFQTLGTNFTWEAWIHLECCTTYGGHGFGAIFDVGQNGRDVPGAVLQHNQAAWNFHCYRPDGSSSQALATNSVVLGTWQHIACSASGTGVELYIDGELAASTPDTCDISEMQTFFQSAISGYTRWAGAYDYILGSIDEMRVWNVTRTQAQIKASMHTPLAGNEPGLLVYHPLDEGSGNVLTDVSGNGYSGARGSAQWETSAAPMFLMSSSALLGADGIAVDANADLIPGGVLISPFRVDTTAPTVVALTPALDVCPQILYPGSIALQFDDELNPASLDSANISLKSAGPDEMLGNADDWVVPFNSAYVQATRTLTVAPLSTLANDAYRLVISDLVENSSGIPLDGEYPGASGVGNPLPSGDGMPGGSFVLDFGVNAEGDCNVNAIPDACELGDNDVNSNGIPDDCEDCNGNGIVDECDISCDGGGGGCDFEGCGQSTDCNTNGTPDECELVQANASAFFDGVNDLIHVARPETITLVDALTFEAWIKPSSSGPYHSRIIRTRSSINTGNILSWQQNGDKRLQLRIDGALSGSLAVKDDVDTSTYVGAWHHVAGVYSASGGFARLYVDGVLKGELAAVGPIRFSGADLWIGNSEGIDAGFHGQIDEVRVWSVSRSQSEILDSMHRPLFGTEPGLVGYWQLDEGQGQTAFDASTSGDHGRLGIDDSPLGDGNDPLWSVEGSPIPVTDCNANGTLDECDIANEISEDCNENSIPDDCEPGGLDDCDGDGISDLCEFYIGEVIDCDNDGVPDACQLSMNDCNDNGVPDQCEPDCSNDGVPDACELSDGDCNANGVPDICELQQANYALDFDGVDDSVRVPRDPSFEPALELTLEAWIRPDSGGSFHSRILRNAGSFNSGYILSWQQGGNGRLQLRIDGASQGSVYPTDTVPTSTYFGQWHHVAGVYSATGGYARIYVDGILKDEKPAVGTLLYSGNDLGIGNFFAGSNEDFDGLIDEVRIWSVARTQPQLVQDMYRSLLGTEAGLVGYWKLNEGSGQQVLDSSPSGNHGRRGVDDLPQGDIADPAWLISNSPIPVNDCNLNNRPDECDIADLTSSDCNANGIPDECEPGGSADCDGNGISDLCELYTGTSPDCDNDSVPDVCQLSGNDCNGNDIPDECDLIGNDCNGNGIPDDCEIAAGADDCNANGILDTCETDSKAGSLQFDGVDDWCNIPIDVSETAYTVSIWFRTTSMNCALYSVRAGPPGSVNNDRNIYLDNGDIVANIWDQEYIRAAGVDVSDGSWHQVTHTYGGSVGGQRLYIDGILGATGIKSSSDFDWQTNVTLGFANVATSDFFQGEVAEVRIWNAAFSPEDASRNHFNYAPVRPQNLLGQWGFDELSPEQQILDSSSNENDGTLGGSLLADADDPTRQPFGMISDFPQDCNENGVLDECEIAGESSEDCNENGIPDECESGGMEDCDGDGVTNLCEIYLGTENDCQQNGVPDACELSSDCNGNEIPDECEALGNDCDADGVPNICEIAAGAEDCNLNGIPDSCEYVSRISALDFDGINDYVDLEDGVWFNGDFTVEGWLLLRSVRPWSRLVDFGNGAPNDNLLCSLSYQNTGAPYLQVADGTATASPRVISSQVIPLGVWVHLAFVGSGQTGKIYINGELTGSGPLNQPNAVVRTRNYIARSNWSSDAYPDALFDEIRVWNVAREGANIAAGLHLPMDPNAPGLVAYWKLDDAMGQIVSDETPSARDGILGTSLSIENTDPSWHDGGALSVNDCNANSSLDECDISNDVIEDCNDNNVPDDCEASDDCNSNGVQDICDIAGGMPDCDNNLVPDACELTGDDCNENNVPDICEPGGNVDCDGNGVVDLCDLVSDAGMDCNGNGTLDSCDITSGASTDVDANGIPDDCETEVRVMPVATLINPALTSEVRNELPDSISLVHEGSRYFLEIWVSDVGSVMQGLSGVYVDVTFCGTTVATHIEHGGTFDFLPEGTIQPGRVDEFGAATFDAGVAVGPEWVRLGWIEMRPGEGSPCSIAIQPSQNGIGAPAPVNWAFVDLGTLDLQVEPTTVTYDLNGDGFIGFGDFSLFLGSWLQTVPPANPDHDFDCDGIVGPGDLSWFATGWQKDADDPSILYPVCDGGRGGSPGESDIRTALVALEMPSANDTTTTLPASIASIPLGETYVMELWVSDAGDVNSGITSAYFDVTIPTPVSDVEAVSVAGVWPLFDNASVDGIGMVDELGGSILEQGFAVAPEWTRVGVIEVLATGPAPAATFAIRPGQNGVAAYARGLIPWSSTELSSVTITQGVVGDIDGDNDVDMNDLSLLLEVLTGNDVFGDLNFDGAIDGLDIPLFVQGRLLGEHDEATLIPFVENLLNAATPIPTARHRLAADLNGDGFVDGGDIQAFVSAIVGQ